MIFCIAKPYMIKFYFTIYHSRREGSFFFNVVIIIQYLEYPFAGNHSHLYGIKLIGNDSQWTEDKIEVLNKGNNFTILTNISIQCFPCCPPYYKTHRERQNYFYDREKNRIGEYGFYIGISVFLIDSPKLSVFFVFRCKSLYDIHACYMLLHES